MDGSRHGAKGKKLEFLEVPVVAGKAGTGVRCYLKLHSLFHFLEALSARPITCSMGAVGGR